MSTPDVSDESKPSDYHVYVDGSFIDNRVGYGVVILRDGAMVQEFFGAVDDPAVQSMRQVAGELTATLTALAWCRENGLTQVTLFYDYAGIEAWATGKWKTNLDATRTYAATAKDYRAAMRITWRKIASHTGDRWNERADVLAKQGASQSTRPSVQEVQTAKTSGEPDAALIDQLRETTDRFVAFLTDHGIAARFTQVYNAQFARIIISANGQDVGVFDLYNTTRKPLSPYLHNFKGTALKTQTERHWKAFRAG